MSVQSDDDAYNRGYSFALNLGTVQAEQYLSTHAGDLSATSGEAHWYAVGVLEARSGKPYRVPSARTTGTANPPAGYVTPPTPGSVAGTPVTGTPVTVRPAPPYQSQGGGGGVILNPPTTPPFTPPVVVYQPSPRFRYLEVCGFLFTKRIPYDAAVNLDRTEGGMLVQLVKSWSVSFRLLGDAPGEQREGYHLSGPSGPIARRVAAMVNAGIFIPDPRAYGLSDWVAAKTRDGIKFLSSAELEQLGLFSDP